MRTALLTVNVYDNYGNMLQKYALYRTLEKLAGFSEVLWHHSTKPFTPYDLEINRQLTGTVRLSAFRCVRENKFKEFEDTYVRTRFDLPYLEDVADDYDYFVVGSDQVWNPDLCVPGNFCEFAPPEKRIAYAASIAVPEIPPHLAGYFREKILEMPHVSIREREGVELVEKLTGRKVPQVVDPVFLLEADEWRKIAKPPTWFSKKNYERGYVLTYFFTGKPPEQVVDLAAKLGLPLINLLDWDNFHHYVTGIEEFLYLVDHATLFCTQSFHGTSFALILKRPFIVYKLQLGRMVQRFSRFESLLELFGLSERATDVDLEIKPEDPLQIDFSRRDEVLPVERERSLDFLKTALGLKQPEQAEPPISEPPVQVELDVDLDDEEEPFIIEASEQDKPLIDETPVKVETPDKVETPAEVEAPAQIKQPDDEPSKGKSRKKRKRRK